jgi:endonuclease YncB( thermonuclease family)
MKHALIALALVIATDGRAFAEKFAGPVSARVVEVIDGDTFRAEANVWPGHIVRVSIRVRGIDAPEMHARCTAERIAARTARSILAELLGPSALISNIAGAKYYGRVLADVRTHDGVAVADRLIALGLARPYSGGRRAGWCG